jgi:hypothetical protein
MSEAQGATMFFALWSFVLWSGALVAMFYLLLDLDKVSRRESSLVVRMLHRRR